MRGLTQDEPFIRQTSSGHEYYHLDVLGSPLVLSNGLGVSTTSYSYGPFGQTTVTGASSNAFQFTGRENDDTGLYYYRARYYSPTFQRFISEDPIGLAAGDPNFYGYVGNNPIGARDPNGLLSPPLHFYRTYRDAYDNGAGFFESVGRGLATANIDMPWSVGCCDPAASVQNQHGMGGFINGEAQTAEAARAGILAAINSAIQNGDRPGAIHNGQDLAMPLHLDHVFKGLGWDFETVRHTIGDYFPLPATTDRVNQNTRTVNEAFESGAQLEMGPDGLLRQKGEGQPTEGGQPLGRRKP